MILSFSCSMWFIIVIFVRFFCAFGKLYCVYNNFCGRHVPFSSFTSSLSISFIFKNCHYFGCLLLNTFFFLSPSTSTSTSTLNNINFNYSSLQLCDIHLLVSQSPFFEQQLCSVKH